MNPNTPLPVFIGYDPRQPVAFQVAAHSVLAHASKPVAITALVLSQLPIRRRGLTEFTFSRFLVPFLCGFEGRSVFLDADMLCLGDITELLTLSEADRHANGDAAVWVVKNERRFEWASMMVFDNARCRALTPAFVDDPTTDPFSLAWASRVGDLPRDWNQLVCYDPPNPKAKLIHFTQGLPCWPETTGVEFADAWHKAAAASMSTVSYQALMGNSVHNKHVQARLAQQAEMAAK